MARPTPELIEALRKTAKNLENNAVYEWGHMGSCNCGNLVQQLTNLSKGEIHEYAMRGRGDWNQQIMDFCPTSGMPMDLLISQLLDIGLSRDDLMNLEKLSDPEILANLPESRKYLRHNVKEDVVLYIKTWAQTLENQLAGTITLPLIESEALNQSVTL